MPLTDRSIITLDELKAYINVEASDATKDTLLYSIIDLCSGRIEEAIDSAVAPQDTTEILDGTGTRVLTLESFISDIYGSTDPDRLDNVQYRNGPDDAWTNLVTDIDHLELDGKGIELLGTTSSIRMASGFPRGRKNIKVRYYAGFDPVPAKLKVVCLEMSAMMFKESGVGGGQLGMNSMNMGVGGGSSASTYKDLESKWQTVFDEYQDYEDTISVINL
jgi:hypothetical protein